MLLNPPTGSVFPCSVPIQYIMTTYVAAMPCKPRASYVKRRLSRLGGLPCTYYAARLQRNRHILLACASALAFAHPQSSSRNTHRPRSPYAVLLSLRRSRRKRRRRREGALDGWFARVREGPSEAGVETL